ncbi:MAG: energy-coupling factor transporter transmembrane protein EcfT [Lachnospiraceae bacterium]|nr:energy-coupling factor transporter transmembrane protein EcfT [Lachnospiraceae bacterium]
MKNKDTFSGYHPLVNFMYFGLVIGFSMFFMHPVCLLISLICAVSYHIKLNGKNSLRVLVRYAVPVMLATALINPAFNHEGTFILYYLPTGNPLTLESILYGIAAAVMLVSVLLWFGCYTAVMTSDKFVYLFGRIIPVMSLVLSMTLRFVPKFKAQLECVKETQACMGRDSTDGSLWKRLKCTFTCFSIMITWSLENAVETADSMKGRGYGLKGRTAFSVYILTERDKAALLWLGFCGVYLFGGSLSGGLFWRYFPSIRGILTEPMTISFEIIYFTLCITPLIINGREERLWKSLQSKI